MAIHIHGFIKREDPFPHIEGHRALCTHCGAVITADTTQELDELHAGDTPCPHCGGHQVCGCMHCVSTADDYNDPDAWTCAMCKYTDNYADERTCAVCGTERI